VYPLYAGDLYNYLHAEGSFASSLAKNYSIEMNFKLNLICEFVEGMAGKIYFQRERKKRDSDLLL